MNYGKHFSTRRTPQSQALLGQVPNSAGGHAFQIDKWQGLQRFLVLGSMGGSYYVEEKDLTIENAQSIQECIKEDGVRVVREIVEVSSEGRAAKNDPALFALAMCAGAADVTVRQAAIEALPKVARIGTHLFHFAEYVENFRGWGRSLRRGVGDWYKNQHIDNLAYQAVKYKQRDGWSHRDLLRLSHPKGNAEQKAVYDWICGREVPSTALPLVAAHADAVHLAAETDAKVATRLAIDAIREVNLPREALPTELLENPEVWTAMLPRMPLTAMIRNLGKMSSLGILKPMSDESEIVVKKLADLPAMQKARVHPMAILLALATYRSGHGVRGNLKWTADETIVGALDRAFYLSFKAVVPTDKRILLALDVSGSMTYPLMNSPLSCREGTAALALVTASVEAKYHICGFTGEMVPLTINKGMSLADAVQTVSRLQFGRTDCAQPMLYALEKGIEADAFVIYTDSETWCGDIHPVQALQLYKEKMGIDAKLVVNAMVPNPFSIADPTNPNMLDVVGFDANSPSVVADFCR